MVPSSPAWKQQVSQNYWYLSIKVHGVTSQKIKITIRKTVVLWQMDCVCTKPINEIQAPGLCHENLKQNSSSYDTPALTRTSCRLKKESNDAENTSQTNQNAGSFLCLGGCMDLMEVMLAMQPWPRASSWGRDLSITSHPDRLICTKLQAVYSFHFPAHLLFGVNVVFFFLSFPSFICFLVSPSYLLHYRISY